MILSTLHHKLTWCSAGVTAFFMGWYVPVEGEIKPLLQLFAHEGDSPLTIGGAHTPGPAGPPQLIICEVVQTLLLDHPVITLHYAHTVWSHDTRTLWSQYTRTVW